MIARGSLGNPWIFEELTGRRTAPPAREEIGGRAALGVDRAEEHLGRRAGGTLPAQVLPLVHGAAGAPAAVADELPAQRRASAERRELARQLARAPLCGAPLWPLSERPRYNPATSALVRRPKPSHPGVFRVWGAPFPPATSKSEVTKSEPAVRNHPGRAREAQGGDRVPLDREAARGSGADQGGARVRRHHRELRVRRRQERAGDARAADRPARGEAAPRDGDRREGSRAPTRSASAPSSTSRTRSPATRSKFQIVGSAEANPLEHKLSNESPIGKALVGHKRNDIVTVEVPRGPEEEAQDHQDRVGLAVSHRLAPR